MKTNKLSSPMLAASLSMLLEMTLLAYCFVNPWPSRIFLWVMDWPKASGAFGQFAAIAVLLAVILCILLPPVSLISRQTREYLFGR